MSGKNDIESGSAAPLLYPAMNESPELRWAFIRKVYSILAIQLLLTVAVASAVVKLESVSRFFSTTTVGLVIYIMIILTPFIVLYPLILYQKKHPVNYILLGVFTLALAFTLGLSCAYTDGRVILEAFILTATLVISLTVYTFWAAKRGQDFNFLGPFLFGGLSILIVFGFIQIFFPLGKVLTMSLGLVGALIMCGYIVYDTDQLIKRYSYDDYIIAAVMLYLDVLNLFLYLIEILSAKD